MLRCAEVDRVFDLRMHMVPDHLRELAQLCRTARPAHSLVSDFRSRRAGTYSDSRVILTLQYLTEEGVLGPASSSCW